MGHFEVVRGVDSDILFRLRDAENGNLVDDDDWVDGSTAAEWAVVTFKLGATDKTSDFVKDITSDALTGSQIKHPDPTTGIIRDSKGNYRVRVNPAIALSLTDYTIEIVADINGESKVETHTFTLKEGGDIEIGSSIAYTTEEEVLDNFEFETIVTSTQVTKARTAADRKVNAYLKTRGLSTPHAKLDTLTEAAIAAARAELRRLATGIPGPGHGLDTLKEGDTTYKFDRDYIRAQYQEFLFWMERAFEEIFGMIDMDVASMNLPDE